MLPLGQALWLNELESYKEFRPLQAPEAYNLEGIIAEMKAAKTASHALVV
jgi:arylsulfatase